MVKKSRFLSANDAPTSVESIPSIPNPPVLDVDDTDSGISNRFHARRVLRIPRCTMLFSGMRWAVCDAIQIFENGMSEGLIFCLISESMLLHFSR